MPFNSRKRKRPNGSRRRRTRKASTTFRRSIKSRGFTRRNSSASRGFGSRKRRTFRGRRTIGGRKRRVIRSARAIGRGARIVGRVQRPKLSLRRIPGPADKYTLTGDTARVNVLAARASELFQQHWGYGTAIGSILGFIRTESPYTLVGGTGATTLLQPKLVVEGHTTTTFVAAGNARVFGEMRIFTPRIIGTGQTVAAFGTQWDAAILQTYDVSPTTPTAVDLWPSFRMGHNRAFWGKLYRTVAKYKLDFGPGRPQQVIFKPGTKVFDQQDYNFATGGWLSTNGGTPGKTFYAMYRFWCEKGQICADTAVGVDNAMIGEVSTDMMVQTRQHYTYKWCPGNNKPSWFGSQIGAAESLGTQQSTFVGVPALKVPRFSASGYNGLISVTQFGAQHPTSRLEVNDHFVPGCDPLASALPLVGLSTVAGSGLGSNCDFPIRTLACP